MLDRGRKPETSPDGHLLQAATQADALTTDGRLVTDSDVFDANSSPTVDLAAWADIYKALADRTRLHILALLKQDEMCVCELVEVLGMTQPAISQHLRKLKQAGWVSERKTAQWVFYRLDGTHIPISFACVEALPDASAEIAAIQARGLRVTCQTRPGRGAGSSL